MIEEYDDEQTTQIPCIYLNDICNVQEAINKNLFSESSHGLDKYLSTHRVYKFGFASNYLDRMKQEHRKEHKMFNVKYIFNRYIDPAFLKEAESYIRNQTVIDGNKLQNGSNDYFVVDGNNEKEFKKIVFAFDGATKIFSKSTVELNRRVEALQADIKIMERDHQLSIKDKDMELMNKDMELINKDKQIQAQIHEKEMLKQTLISKDQEIEIEKLKRMLLEK